MESVKNLSGQIRKNVVVCTIRTFLTYDNHHNYVGHVRDLFLLIRGLFDNDTIAQGLIDQRLFALTHVDATTKPGGKSLNSWSFYKGKHWRLVSLHFHSIFEDLWASTSVFENLFACLTEIHLLNYLHWDRFHNSLKTVILRYQLLLFIYTEQLQQLFTVDELNNLNTMYLHKILVHSARLFKHLNLAACTCEQGEGSISIINRYLKLTHGVLDQTALRKVFLQIVLEEESASNVKHKIHEKSPVFGKKFLASQKPKEIRLLLTKSGSTAINNFLISGNFSIESREWTVSRGNQQTKYTFRTLSLFKTAFQLAIIEDDADDENELIAESVDINPIIAERSVSVTTSATIEYAENNGRQTVEAGSILIEHEEVNSESNVYLDIIRINLDVKNRIRSNTVVPLDPLLNLQHRVIKQDSRRSDYLITQNNIFELLNSTLTKIEKDLRLTSNYLEATNMQNIGLELILNFLILLFYITCILLMNIITLLITTKHKAYVQDRLRAAKGIY